jgi:hypothetical protein
VAGRSHLRSAASFARILLLQVTVLALVFAVSQSGACKGCWKSDLTDDAVVQAEAQGERIRVALEAYAAEHGRYPRRLSALDIPRAERRLDCGTAWTYRRQADDPAGYTLYLGDYDENGFQLAWWQGYGWRWET